MGGLFTFVKTIFCIPVKNKMPLIHWGMDESLISESWESTMHYGWGRGRWVGECSYDESNTLCIRKLDYMKKIWYEDRFR